MSDNKNIRTPENSNSGADKNAHVQYTVADKQVETIGRSLRGRLREVKTTRWIRFAVVSVIFFLWVIWMGNPWLMFVWIILADIYLTCYIPWNWWKKSDNKLVRTLMNWVDAIVYALILVYFIFAFIGQNYTIPSSSLEKSLLVGDYLWVNKAIYGPRVPQTPLHFPLTQHTLPIVNTQSYFTNPQLDYHRLPGVRSVERGDIVVFNYPQGDTVVTGIEMFHKLLDYAEAGDNIGALLRGVAKTEIERGQVLSKPGSIHPHTKFVGQVYVLTKDEGGRHTPFFNNYRPQFYFRTTDVTGIITLPEGTEMCMPGDNVDMNVELITPIAIENGLRFAIREGGRTVGSGVVIAINND